MVGVGQRETTEMIYIVALTIIHIIFAVLLYNFYL